MLLFHPHIIDDSHTYSSRIFILDHILLGRLGSILLLAVLFYDSYIDP